MLIRKIKNKLNPINVFQIYAERSKKNENENSNNKKISINNSFNPLNIKEFKLPEISQCNAKSKFSPNESIFKQNLLFRPMRNKEPYSSKIKPITFSNENSTTNSKTDYKMIHRYFGKINIFSRELSPRFHNIQNSDKSVNYPINSKVKNYLKLQSLQKCINLDDSENYSSSLKSTNKNEINLKNPDLTLNNDLQAENPKLNKMKKIIFRSNYSNFVRFNNSLLINNELKLALRKSKLNLSLSHKIRDILQYSHSDK